MLPLIGDILTFFFFTFLIRFLQTHDHLQPYTYILHYKTEKELYVVIFFNYFQFQLKFCIDYIANPLTAIFERLFPLFYISKFQTNT